MVKKVKGFEYLLIESAFLILFHQAYFESSRKRVLKSTCWFQIDELCAIDVCSKSKKPSQELVNNYLRMIWIVGCFKEKRIVCQPAHSQLCRVYVLSLKRIAIIYFAV